MGIMKLSNVPEMTEFTGTEKIYVNDNGETKQIACDKVVTGGGGDKIVWDTSNYEEDCMEDIVSAIENGKDVWLLKDGQLAKFLSFALYNFCGGLYTLIGSYISINESGSNGGGGTIKTIMVNNTSIPSSSEHYDRLIALGL